MVSLLAKIFGTKSVIDGGMKILDNIVYTKEEKATAKIALLRAYEPFKLAQRLLALIVCIPYVVLFVVAAVMTLFDLKPEAIKSLWELSQGWDMGLAFVLILGFYFGGGAFEGYIRAKTKE